MGGNTRVENVEIHALTNSAFHGITISALLKFALNLEVPLCIDGWISSPDDKIIGVIHKLPDTSVNRYQLGANDPFQPTQGETNYDVNALVPLSRESIEFLEQLRNKDKKRDVKLKVTIEITTLWSKATISHLIADSNLKLRLVSPNLAGSNLAEDSVVIYKYSRDYNPNQSDMHILSGSGDRNFLELIRSRTVHNVTIAASDWVQDYAPALGIGKSFSIELPMPEELDLPKDVKERFKVAIDDLNKMLGDYRHGDWSDLVENSRGVYELLKDKQLVHDLLESDGYPADAITDISNCLAALWNFTSKFHHHLDRDKEKLKPEIKASKEEAELIYALSLTLVNLLARKAKRQNQ